MCLRGTSGQADKRTSKVGASEFSGRVKRLFQRRGFTAGRRGSARPVACRSSDKPAIAASPRRHSGSPQERQATIRKSPFHSNRQPWHQPQSHPTAHNRLAWLGRSLALPFHAAARKKKKRAGFYSDAPFDFTDSHPGGIREPLPSSARSIRSIRRSRSRTHAPTAFRPEQARR